MLTQPVIAAKLGDGIGEGDEGLTVSLAATVRRRSRHVRASALRSAV